MRRATTMVFLTMLVLSAVEWWVGAPLAGEHQGCDAQVWCVKPASPTWLLRTRALGVVPVLALIAIGLRRLVSREVGREPAPESIPWRVGLPITVLALLPLGWALLAETLLWTILSAWWTLGLTLACAEVVLLLACVETLARTAWSRARPALATQLAALVLLVVLALLRVSRCAPWMPWTVWGVLVVSVIGSLVLVLDGLARTPDLHPAVPISLTDVVLVDAVVAAGWLGHQWISGITQAGAVTWR